MQALQRLHGVGVGLAGSNDPDPGARARPRQAVEPGHPGELHRRRQLVHVQALLRGRRHLERADMQGPVGVRQRPHRLLLPYFDFAGGFHHVGHQLHANPASGAARHLDAPQAKVDDVLDVGRIQHRYARRDQREIRLVGGGRRLGAMVVSRQHQHAAGCAGSGQVAVLQRVAAAIHARPLAVPDAKHAIHRGAGKAANVLRAPHGGGGQVLVDAGLEAYVRGPQQRLDAPQLHIQPAQRRAAVPRDKAPGVLAEAGIDAALVQRDAQDRLVAGEEHLAGRLLKPVVQAGRLQCRRLRPRVHAAPPLSAVASAVATRLPLVRGRRQAVIETNSVMNKQKKKRRGQSKALRVLHANALLPRCQGLLARYRGIARELRGHGRPQRRAARGGVGR